MVRYTVLADIEKDIIAFQSFDSEEAASCFLNHIKNFENKNNDLRKAYIDGFVDSMGILKVADLADQIWTKCNFPEYSDTKDFIKDVFYQFGINEAFQWNDVHIKIGGFHPTKKVKYENKRIVKSQSFNE